MPLSCRLAVGTGMLLLLHVCSKCTQLLLLTCSVMRNMLCDAWLVLDELLKRLREQHLLQSIYAVRQDIAAWCTWRPEGRRERGRCKRRAWRWRRWAPSCRRAPCCAA